MMKEHLTHIAVAYNGVAALKRKPIRAQVHSIDRDIFSTIMDPHELNDKEDTVSQFWLAF